MEWLKDIGFSGAGLPWWAAFVLMFLTLIFTKGKDFWRAIRGINLEERKYEDDQTREAREALIAELKEQVKGLKTDMAGVLGELKETRAAHSKCEIGQAELRGEMNVLKVRLEALERHDKANKEQIALSTAELKEQVQTIKETVKQHTEPLT